MAQRKTAGKSRGKARTAAKAAKASPKKRASSGRRPAAGRKSSAGARQVTVDRRRKPGRREEDRSDAPKSAARPPKLERRKKVSRRRQIDPTTCERDYTGDEIEFMNALDRYKRTSGRMFPTCSEVLEVVRSLGYVKSPRGEPAELHAADADDRPTPPSGPAAACEPEPVSVQ